MLAGTVTNRAAFSGAVLFYGLTALLVFAPLYWGGNRPLPLLVMELAALALLVGLAWSRSKPIQPAVLSWPMRVFLVVFLLLPLLQLLPLPLPLWADLPGREFYAGALRLAGVDGTDFDWRAISLVPSSTEVAWLALLPPLAVFVAASGLSGRRLLALVQLFLGIAVGQALLGLIQYGDGVDSVFRFGNTLMGGSASGTYVNRNHLAGLLEMALPVALALLAATVGHGLPRYTGHGRRQRTLRQWLARFSVNRINQATLYGATALVLLLGLVFTRSRAGVSLAMLGILLCTALFSTRLGGRNAYGLMGTFTAVGVGLAGLIGLTPVWGRFAYSDPIEDGRWRIFDATLQAVGEFFPLGSGGGTFEDILRRFHPVDFLGVTINRAHNDYLEWLLEFGLAAALLIAVWLVFYLRQWGRVWKRGEWASLRFVQAGAGIALLLMMLHTLVDFNLRIPANAVFTALLAAVFFHRPVEEERQSTRQRRGASGASDGGEPADALAPAYEIPPENRTNPFTS
ncbi:MAG: O-antigen ligase family protein [Candidatus Competibacteraceae bacterium]|nr:MAG: O-antigen ligase family protein [Candidatus Competibacteraceae bacterium]